MAVWLGKILVRLLGFWGSGATSLPGLLCRMIDPDILQNMCRQCRLGTIVITGTNGKTTTSRMIKKVLESGGYHVVCNGEGSNLERGLISSLVKESNWRGVLDYDIGVFEVDEADLKNLIGRLYCRQLVVTNFFRDQLDRFGELDYLKKIIVQAIGEMSAGSTLVLNADDPFVASLGSEVDPTKSVKYYGLDLESRAQNTESTDVVDCQKCGEKLYYEKRYLAQVGKYYCRKCGLKRPALDWMVDQYRGGGVDGMSLRVKNQVWGVFNLQVNLPGFFNIYNVLAALTVVSSLDLEKELVIDTINKFMPVFGRFEKVRLGDKQLVLMLAKNPTGFNELLKTILEDERKLKLLAILNDNYADGRDVSWIWDVNFEWLRGHLEWVCVAGRRAEDLMLRFKYADIDLRLIGMEKNYDKIMADFTQLNDSGYIYVLATYTGMMDFRKKLVQKGMLADFWME